MIELKTPRGLPARVPEHLQEDPSVRFGIDDLVAACEYYERNGYVLFKGLLAPGVCDKVRHLWDAEVKPYEGYIYRQATAKAETHAKNSSGWVMNPILNLQSVDPGTFPEFRSYSTRCVLADRRLATVFAVLL